MEGLAARALVVDLDRDVAAFWRAALMHGEDLASRVLRFPLSRATIEELEKRVPETVLDHGFRTLVLNRTRRGGVLAPGAALHPQRREWQLRRGGTRRLSLIVSPRLPPTPTG